MKCTPETQEAKDESHLLLLLILFVTISLNHFYVRAASLELDTFSLVVLSHPYIVIFELPDYSLLPTPLPKKRKYYVSESFCLFRNILILNFAS